MREKKGKKDRQKLSRDSLSLTETMSVFPRITWELDDHVSTKLSLRLATWQISVKLSPGSLPKVSFLIFINSFSAEDLLK